MEYLSQISIQNDLRSEKENSQCFRNAIIANLGRENNTSLVYMYNNYRNFM